MRAQGPFLASLLAASSLAVAHAAPCEPRHVELVDRADRSLRGETAQGRMSLRVHRRGTSRLRVRFWAKGRGDFLLRVESPSALRGAATLKTEGKLWSYLPSVDRTTRLGTSMMGSAWMGSHLTHDDLVKETELRRHYDCVEAAADGGELTVTLRPRADAPVVWGKVEMRIREKDAVPRESRYYDEGGALRRTLRFSRVREVDGRAVPTRLVVQPADSESERTVVTYDRLRFDAPLPERTFSLQGLRR